MNDTTFLPRNDVWECLYNNDPPDEEGACHTYAAYLIKTTGRKFRDEDIRKIIRFMCDNGTIDTHTIRNIIDATNKKPLVELLMEV